MWTWELMRFNSKYSSLRQLIFAAAYLGTATGSIARQPEWIGAWPELPRGVYESVLVDGDVAYCAVGSAGLQIIDVSNPTSPVAMGRADTPGYAYRVALHAGYAYVADGETGVQVINVSDPLNPQWVASADTDGVAYDVVVKNGHIHVADGLEGLHIFEMQDAETLITVSSL